MSIVHRERRGVHPAAWLYALSLVVNLSAGLAYRFRASPDLLEADELEYFGIATSLLTGDLELNGRRTLGFPLVLAGLRLISDDFLVLQSLTVAIYSLSAPLLFVLVKRLGGADRTAMLAGSALTLWPPAIFYGASLYSESVALPVFLLALICLPVGSRLAGGGPSPQLGRCLAAGLTLALATHVRTMYQLFVPVVALIAIVEERRLGTAAARFGVVVAAFLLGILPWSLRVSNQLGRTVLVTSNGGETLAGAMTPRLLRQERLADTVTSGRNAWVGPGKWVPIEQTGYLSPAELRLPYVRQDALLRERAVAWMTANPADAAFLVAAKVGYMWGVYPLDRNSLPQVAFGNIPTILLLLLALALAAIAPRAAFPLVRLWSLPLFVTGVALISWGSWRFRQPGDAGLIAFCALMAWHIWRNGRMGRSSALA